MDSDAETLIAMARAAGEKPLILLLKGKKLKASEIFKDALDDEEGLFVAYLRGIRKDSGLRKRLLEIAELWSWTEPAGT